MRKRRRKKNNNNNNKNKNQPFAFKISNVIGSKHFGLVLGDHAQVDVAARSEIVEDTRTDGIGDERFGLFLAHVGLVAILEHGHGGERARAHGHVGRAIARAVRCDRAQVRSGDIDAAEHEGSAHVALIAEQILSQQSIGRAHAHLSARVESMQLELRRDHAGRERCVRSRASTAAAFYFFLVSINSQLC